MPPRDDRNKSSRNDGNDPSGRHPRPSVTPTSASTLVVAGLAMAALSWLAISRFYGNFPAIPWLPGLTLLALAGLEFVAAVNTKARIDRRRGTEPVDPLLVARYVVLAKASALAAALFTGLYAGVVAWLVTEQGRLTQAEDDLTPAVVGLVGSVALVAAALTLERACRVPPPPPSSDPAQPGWAGEGAEADPQEADG
jgi:Protein of unknown function (DUF3180)